VVNKKMDLEEKVIRLRMRINKFKKKFEKELVKETEKEKAIFVFDEKESYLVRNNNE
tara:strand:+ start:54 stop:224 length:171 start_codon:yes stop_codon:yes gene_type:complete